MLSFGYQLWQSLFNNFAVEELGVRADQMGLIQSIREIPGLLGLSVGLLALLLSEMHIAMVQELGHEPDEAEAECRRDYERGYGREK